MKLTLATKELHNQKDDNGITKIGMKGLIVIDDKTGEELEGCSGLIWGDRDLLLKPMEESLLTPEHLEGHPDDASYMILVIRCDEAIEI